MNLNECSRGKWIINTPLGSGKSRSIIEMAQKGMFETPHLIVVDTKEEVDRYRSELPEYKWYYKTKEDKVKEKTREVLNSVIELRRMSEYMFLDILIKGLSTRLKDKEEVFSSDKGLIITKAMFNKYFEYQYIDPFEKFKTITIDEVSNLDILPSFPLKNEYVSLLSNQPNFKEKLTRSKLEELTTPLIENPLTFLEELLKANATYFLRKNQYKNGTEIVLKNTKLFSLLNRADINIQILDATAKYNNYLYINLRGYRYHQESSKPYSSLTINNIIFYTGCEIKISKFRVDYRDKKKEVNRKLELIKNLNIKSSLIFSNKSTIDALKGTDIFTDQCHKLDYFYSGRDIGTNQYRDFNNLCILYGQKINDEHVKILSRYFKVDQDKLRDNLISSRVIQLIGRTAIRKDNLNKVTINIINFPELSVDSVLSHYHGSTYNKSTLTIKMKEVTNVGKIMQYIELNNLKFDGYTSKELKNTIREIIAKLGLKLKDDKAMLNLIGSVKKKLFPPEL